MKKLVILSAIAALASLAMSAKALPSGYQSVNFKATVVVQDGDLTKNVSITDKDLLYLIGQEFGDTIPNGAKLVMYGLDYEEFGVLNSNNSVFIGNASTHGGDYEMKPYAVYSDDDYVYNEKSNSDTYQWTDDDCGLTYEDATDTYYLNFSGMGKINDNYDNYDESFKFTGVGNCYLPSGDLKGYGTFGIVNGSLSGSGKDVYTFDY